jgi:hypothetical protein
MIGGACRAARTAEVGGRRRRNITAMPAPPARAKMAGTSQGVGRFAPALTLTCPWAGRWALAPAATDRTNSGRAGGGGLAGMMRRTSAAVGSASAGVTTDGAARATCGCVPGAVVAPGATCTGGRSDELGPTRPGRAGSWRIATACRGEAGRTERVVGPPFTARTSIPETDAVGCSSGSPGATASGTAADSVGASGCPAIGDASGAAGPESG